MKFNKSVFAFCLILFVAPDLCFSNEPVESKNLPSDEEISKLIIGTWSWRLQGSKTYIYGQSTYQENGKGFGYIEITKANEPGQVGATRRKNNRFNWKVEKGFFSIESKSNLGAENPGGSNVTKERILLINDQVFRTYHEESETTIERRRKILDTTP